MERLNAFAVGLACSVLQVSLVYAVSFLFSATAPAYLSVMLSWFVGGALGCWLPARLPPRWLFWCAAMLHWWNSWSLLGGNYYKSWLVAGAAGGMAGSYWLCSRTRNDLRSLLIFETMGMAAGFAACHVLIYRLGLGLIWGMPLVAILLTLKEKCIETDERGL